jgi:hypothetical protein
VKRDPLSTPRPVPLAEGVAYLKRVQAEFPEWFIQHLPDRGFVARMGMLRIGPMTLRELEQTLRRSR